MFKEALRSKDVAYRALLDDNTRLEKKLDDLRRQLVSRARVVPGPGGGDDDENLQLMQSQLEHLLTEKQELASENSRLRVEVQSLRREQTLFLQRLSEDDDITMHARQLQAALEDALAARQAAEQELRAKSQALEALERQMERERFDWSMERQEMRALLDQRRAVSSGSGTPTRQPSPSGPSGGIRRAHSQLEAVQLQGGSSPAAGPGNGTPKRGTPSAVGSGSKAFGSPLQPGLVQGRVLDFEARIASPRQPASPSGNMGGRAGR